MRNIVISLSSLEKEITCQLPMTTESKNLLRALQNDEVPHLWNVASYPSSASLRTYIINLNQKYEFYF